MPDTVQEAVAAAALEREGGVCPSMVSDHRDHRSKMGICDLASRHGFLQGHILQEGAEGMTGKGMKS